MLKSTLEVLLKEAEVKIAGFRIDNTKLTAQLRSGTEEIERLNEQSRNYEKRLTQIEQSICTMLRVKYPENQESMSHAIHNCKSATEVMDTMSIDNEEKRFLLLILELSRPMFDVDSVSSLFNHMRRN